MSSFLSAKWYEMTLLAIPARLAISAMLALAYPVSAMTSAAHWTIWARRATSVKVRAGRPAVACITARYYRPYGRKFGRAADFCGGSYGHRRASAWRITADNRGTGSRIRACALCLGGHLRTSVLRHRVVLVGRPAVRPGQVRYGEDGSHPASGGP